MFHSKKKWMKMPIAVSGACRTPSKELETGLLRLRLDKEAEDELGQVEDGFKHAETRFRYTETGFR